jgi:hypothetical protein
MTLAPQLLPQAPPLGHRLTTQPAPAVRQGRVKLLDAQEPDWANYILYGDGRFQLVVG